MLTQKTAAALHNCHQQIMNAENLLAEMRKTLERNNEVDLIDAFGRHRHSLQLGVPSSKSSHTIFNVDPDLAMVIIDAQVMKYKAQLQALNKLATEECLKQECETARGPVTE
jgi:hypothetical protein